MGKFIKTFESFSLGAAIGGGLILSTINYLVQKWAKNSKDRFEKKTLLEFLKDGHTKSVYGWEIKEEGDVIEITKKDKWAGTPLKNSNLTKFRIDKSKDIVEYVSNIIPLSKKLPKSKINKIVDGIEFVKKMTEELEDFRYLIEDMDFEFRVYNFDFYNKSFNIRIFKDRILSLFSPDEIINELIEISNRLKSMYGLHLSNGDELEKKYLTNIDVYESFLCEDGFYYTNIEENAFHAFMTLKIEKDYKSLDKIRCKSISLKFKQI